MHLKLISGLGMVGPIALAWACSLDRRRFPWRTVWWGLGLQIAFAVIILKTRFGQVVFEAARNAVNHLNEFAGEGAKMVLGPLANTALLEGAFGRGNLSILVISISATIILVSALSALLYHWGILQRVVRAIAWVMRRAMGTSGSESLAAAANIFMGMTEAPLVIRPYLNDCLLLLP